MVTHDKIEEWIREAEERPESAATILRYVSRRLKDLSERNEELLSENISLRLGHKVEDYEKRITNLEYQLDLLKRQLGGEQIEAPPDTMSLLLFNTRGQVLRIELDGQNLEPGSVPGTGQNSPSFMEANPQLMAAHTQEELLFVFDSGRTAAKPVSDIPSSGRARLEWEGAFFQEPRGSEELVAILPIARMSLFDSCIQASRRGYIKKIKQSFFQAHIGKQFIGTGVKLPADQTCSLALAGSGAILVLASREGFLLALEVDKLPMTIEEAIRLSSTDYLVSAFVVGDKPFLIGITQGGKVIHREAGWLEPSDALKARGQSLFSKARREAGVRLVGAAAVDENDWVTVLDSTGRISLHPASALFSSGSLPLSGDQDQISGFAAFPNPVR